MRRTAFLFAFALTPAFAFGGEGAQVTERWACYDRFEGGGDVLVRLTRQGDSGQVTVAGMTQFAMFQVAGFDRRWDFGIDEDDTFDYAFIISPNGDGRYLDFTSESVKPSQYYDCRPE